MSSNNSQHDFMKQQAAKKQEGGLGDLLKIQNFPNKE